MSYQKVIIAGNLGRDPEIRFLPNGDAIEFDESAVTSIW